MARYLVTLTSHADGPADELFVDVASARSPFAAIRDAVRACPGLGPFALLRAVPWPRGLRNAEAAARLAARASA